MKQFIAVLCLAVVSLAIGCKKDTDVLVLTNDTAGSPAPAGKKLTMAFMPKSKGNAYFISCKQGADEAAKELGVELLFDGPTDPDPAKQNEIVDNWITLGVDAIAVAC